MHYYMFYGAEQTLNGKKKMIEKCSSYTGSSTSIVVLIFLFYALYSILDNINMFELIYLVSLMQPRMQCSLDVATHLLSI